MPARWSWSWWRFFLAMFIGALLLWGAAVACVIIWSRWEGARPARAIVVLGAAQYGGRPSPVLRARLDHGIALWRKRMAPQIVFTGGRAEGDEMSEGAVGRRYAMRRGVPDSAILVESEGRTTSASLRAVARMLRQDSTGAITSTRRPRVILVSDPFHMLRIAVVAHRVGLRPHTSPTRTSPIDERREIFWRYVISESWKAPLAFVLERDPQSPAAP